MIHSWYWKIIFIYPFFWNWYISFINIIYFCWLLLTSYFLILINYLPYGLLSELFGLCVICHHYQVFRVCMFYVSHSNFYCGDAELIWPSGIRMFSWSDKLLSVRLNELLLFAFAYYSVDWCDGLFSFVEEISGENMVRSVSSITDSTLF